MDVTERRWQGIDREIKEKSAEMGRWTETVKDVSGSSMDRIDNAYIEGSGMATCRLLTE